MECRHEEQEGQDHHGQEKDELLYQEAWGQVKDTRTCVRTTRHLPETQSGLQGPPGPSDPTGEKGLRALPRLSLNTPSDGNLLTFRGEAMVAQPSL